MVARGPGAVGCAHCTRLGAEQACRACGHLVCAACAADWTTCEVATVKTFELEKYSEVVDVDWGGRYVLARRQSGRQIGVFDLRMEAWGVSLHVHDAGGSVTRTGHIVPGRLTSDDGLLLTKSIVEVTVSSRSNGGRRVFEPLKGKVIQGVAVEGDLLAAAAWGELALLRMSGSSLALRTHHALDGEVRWLALAGATLAAADAKQVRAWSVREDGSAHEERLAIERKRPGKRQLARAFALSRDGRFLAVGDTVHDLERRASRTLGSTGEVVFAKFVAADRWLVTCEDDRRVVFRGEYGR